ncbi:hypothetical protein [Sphingomonas immobilis]|uniref:Uncharacterized protein n=1 Tax=Sphingomonas immobilis TaxID=3063997 RepID=A0ABT9A0T5_9SPHN|nr:hypothetical protein [Sphingomonas sp. CA1-15]MDO7843448.1 hypothetical protein [Sphingomonas sp. CA1-15]
MTDKPNTKATQAKPAEVLAASISTSGALDNSGAADITPAAEFSPSGAPRQVTEIDIDHPAVDNDPRAGTTNNQNRIDFNDPTISGQEAVEKALAANQAK